MSRATVAQFKRFGLPASRFSLTDPQIQEHLDAASAEVDDHLRGVVSLPLVAPIPLRLIKAECAIAALSVLDEIGWNPEIGEDNRVKQRADSYEKWLLAVASGSALLFGATDQTPDVEEDAPEVMSEPLRGI